MEIFLNDNYEMILEEEVRSMEEKDILSRSQIDLGKKG